MDITEINHPSNPHLLVLKPPGVPYRCHGCKDLGFGPRYRCENQDCCFILHDICADPSSSATHPFFKGCQFQFHEQAPGFKSRYCDACGQDVLGLVYQCTHEKAHDLHPCCLKLEHVIHGQDLTLKLSKKLPSKCQKCRRRDVVEGVRGWCYVSTCGQYGYHVSCVKEMVLENWKKGYFSRENIGEIQTMVNRDDSPYPFLPSKEIVRRGGRTTGSKIIKYAKMAVLVLKLIVSAIFGEPITLIATLVEALATN